MTNRLASLPDFLRRLPHIDIGIPGVRGYALRGPMLCVMLEFSTDVHVEEHAHGAQYGYVLTGSIRVRRPSGLAGFTAGDSYLIEAGEPHEAWVVGGTTLIEFFEDAVRY